MQIELKRESDRQFLEISVERDNMNKALGRADFREQMILHNKIQGLLGFETIYENDNRILLYNVRNLNTLEAVCQKRKPGKRALEKVLNAILDCVSSGKNYMLCEDDYVIGPQTVFLDSDDNVQIPYCSGYNRDLRLQLCELAEFLMNNVEYSDEGAVLLIYSFYMKCKDETATIDNLSSVLVSTQTNMRPSAQKPEVKEVTEIINQGALAAEDNSSGSNEWQWEGAPSPHLSENYHDPSPAEIFTQSPVRLKVLSLLIPMACVLLAVVILMSGILVNPDTQRNGVIKVFLLSAVCLGICIGSERLIWKRFGRDLTEKLRSAAMREDEATVLLFGDGAENCSFSLVSDEYPTINVTGFPFYIGSKKDRYVDYELKVAGISKYHLKIDREGGEIYVSDLNSTNGTYVNGVRLKPHIPVRVQRGYELRLANVIFYCN